MEEFSNAVVEERDLVTEKLRMKESEIEQERILREELNERLKELQNKVTESSDDSLPCSMFLHSTLTDYLDDFHFSLLHPNTISTLLLLLLFSAACSSSSSSCSSSFLI